MTWSAHYQILNFMAAKSETQDSADPRAGSEGATADAAIPVCSTFKIIPFTKTGTLQEYYGDWEGFCRIARKSIGRDLGGGILRFSTPWPPVSPHQGI
jgi:hypothetical protein